MVAIAASDVTYTINFNAAAGLDGNRRNIKIVFGDGALTYPAGGVPLTSASMGCPNGIQSFVIEENSAAVTTVWKYDVSGNTLRGYDLDDVPAETAGAVAAQELSAVVVGY